MLPRLCLALLGLGLSACATLPPTPSTPYLPAGVYGVYEDNDIGAINQSAWAFAEPSRTRGDPVDAAKAVVAVEYLAGELQSSPRWIGMSSDPKLKMAQARTDLRRIIGIRPDAPPQFVVNGLLGAAAALQAGDQAAALQALSNPAFTLPPPQTLAILSNLPYVQSANIATMQAMSEEYPSGGVRS